MDNIQEQCDKNCPVEVAVNLIGGKYKLLIIHQLSRNKILRFNELRRYFPEITHRTLTRQLRSMEEDGLVLREVYPEVPPRVEYSLSETGKSLHAVLRQIEEWGTNYMATHPTKSL